MLCPPKTFLPNKCSRSSLEMCDVRLLLKWCSRYSMPSHPFHDSFFSLPDIAPKSGSHISHPCRPLSSCVVSHQKTKPKKKGI